MAIYLTKQTSIDGVLQPVGKRLDGLCADGTCRSLIRAGRALVRPARGDDEMDVVEIGATARALDPNGAVWEIVQDGEPEIADGNDDLSDDEPETDEIEQDDEDAIDVDFEVEPAEADQPAPESDEDEQGGVAMDEVDDAPAITDPEPPVYVADPEPPVYATPAEDVDPSESSDEGDPVSIRQIGLSPAVATRLEELGIKTKADALRHAEANGGRFGDELPGIGDIKAQRINAALGL